MAFRFYLDGQLTDQPMNDKDLSTTIKRNSSLGALLITQDVDLEYNGNNAPPPFTISGYSYLKSKFDSGSCQEVTIRITDDTNPIQTIEIYNGVIKVPSIQFDLQQVIAKAKVQDNSFYAYINNNKSIKYDLQSLTTKNGQSITPPTPYDVSLFDGCSATFLPDPYQGYRVYDVLTYLVAAISDNKVGFYSNFLQTEPEIMVFDGFAIGHPNTAPAVKLSFNDLYNELSNAFNLSFFIDTTDPANPIMVMEPTSDLFTGLNEFEFLDIKELQANIREDNLYGTVNAGSDYNPGGADQVYTLPSGTSYFGFADEVFTPKGQCNVDNELGLVNRYKVSNNAINDQVNGGVTDYYDDIFLVEVDNVDTALFTADAVDYPYWTPPNTSCPYAVYYNFRFSNLEKIAAHGNNLQTVLFNTLSVGTGGFQASPGQEQLLVSSDPQYVNQYLIFPGATVINTDVSSPGNYNAGQYSTSTGLYTANSNGTHSFAASYIFDCDNLKLCSSNFTITTAGPGLPVGAYTNVALQDQVYVIAYIKVYNSSNVLLSQTSQTTVIKGGMESAQLGISYVVNLVATDYVQFTIEAKIYKKAVLGGPGSSFPVGTNFNFSLPLHPDFGYGIAGNPWQTWNWPNCPKTPYINIFTQTTSFTACTGTPATGITVGVPQATTFENYEYTFDYDIPQSDWQSIVARPTTLFIFEKDNQRRIGWIDTMKRNDWTGITQIKLVTNNAVTTQ